SPLGFGGEEMLALAGGTHTGTLAWQKGGTTALTVTFTSPNPARYYSFEPGSTCLADVRIDGTLSFVTADGAFDEKFDVQLIAHDTQEVTTSADPDLRKLHGSYVVTSEADSKSFVSVGSDFFITFKSDGMHGSLSGAGTTADEYDGPIVSNTTIYFPIA